MPEKPTIAKVRCPECGFAEALIRKDKGGHPYRYCPDCNAQYFTRGEPKRVENLMRPVTQGSKPEPARESAPEPAPKPAPRKRGTLFG